MLLLPATAAASASQDTLRLLNAERATRGIAPLRWDARLARAARRHSRDLVARHYFDHVSLGGRGLRSRVARTGWTHRRTPWRLAENLAWGSGSLGTPAAIVQTWLNSPHHRRSCSTRACARSASVSRRAPRSRSQARPTRPTSAADRPPGSSDGAGLIRLPQRLPYHLALRVLLTGEPLPAAEASRHTLVTALTAHGAALDQALELGPPARTSCSASALPWPSNRWHRCLLSLDAPADRSRS